MIENAIIVVNVFSGPMPCASQEWIAANFPEGRRFATAKRAPLHAGRNSMIRDVMLPALTENRGVEWCWFMDNDVTITHPGLEHWLDVEGDVVSCRCAMPGGRAWETVDAFHDHFWRCRPAVLRAIPAPWFDLNLSADGCDLLGCDCLTFAAKARAAGFVIRHGGHCEHAAARSWEHG